MNLNEKLADAQARFIECAEGIKSGDADTIERAEQIKAEIEGIKADIATAEKGAALLATMGNVEPKPVKGEQPKSLGEFAAKNLNLASIKGRRGASVSAPEFKSGSQQYLNTGVAEYANSRVIVNPAISTPVRDAFGNESIAENTYSWVVFGQPSGSHEPSGVNEGAAKPELDNVYFKMVEPLHKFAGWFKDTDELLEDNAYLASAIENRGVYRLKKLTDSALAAAIADAAVNGVTDGNSTAAPATSQSIVSATAQADEFANVIFDAVAAVKAASGADCDTVIVTSAVAQLLRTGQDGAGQYYGGGYFTGAYGQPTGYQYMPNLWGMKVIVSDAISNDAHAVVGNFAQGATVISKRDGGVRVEATNSNEDDFVNDLVTIRLEERLLLAVREPAMFAAVVEQ